MRGKPHDFKSMLIYLQGLDLDGNSAREPQELKRECLTILEQLGKGNFSIVSNATFEDRSTNDTHSYAITVAVKILQDDDSAAKKDLLREALLMV